MSDTSTSLGDALQEEPTPMPVVVSEPTSSIVDANYAPQIQGEVDSSDIQIPRISLVQKTSQLADEFSTGDFVLAKVIGLGSTFDFVTLGLRTYFQEDLDYDSDEMPRVWDSRQAMETAGFSTKWETTSPRAVKMIDAMLLVAGEADHESGQFTDSHDGVGYARAMYTVRGSAYRLFAKPIITAGTIGHLKSDLAGGLWTTKSEVQSSGKNTWFAPTVRPNGVVSAKLRKWITKTFDV
jgi:hypothetical protein